MGDPVGYLREFFPCPHWTTVEAHPSFCANCGGSNAPGETCPIRQACDEIDAMAERAEARAAKWKADAEQLAAHYRDDIRYAERVYGPQEWRGRADDGALTLHAALAAEDADEGSGT